MAKQTINIGSTANDGTGDPLRTAFNKANENFTEVYDIAQGAYDYANTKVTFNNTFVLEANDSVTIAYTDGSTSESVFYAEQGRASITVIDSGTPGAKLQLNSSSVAIDNGQGSNPIDLTVSGNVIANGTLTTSNLVVQNTATLTQIAEPFSSIVDANSVVAHDCSTGQIFYHTSLDDNFTANFTNLSLANGEATSLTLVLSQGGTAYIANNVQIGGAAQTVKWSGNTVPTGNTNAVDVQSFSVLRVSGDYIVLGQLSTFG